MIHDLLHADHTKDYRTSALFPIPALDKYALCFIRIDSCFRASLDIVIGEKFNGRPSACLWFHVRDAHLTLCRPGSPTMFFPCGVQIPAAGWAQHLEAAEDSPAIFSLPPCEICDGAEAAHHNLRRTGYETCAI